MKARNDMANQPNSLKPILCAHLLRKVDEKLIDLLSALAPAEWELQTVAPLWKVRDVAAHLLDTALRKLSLVRDSCYVETTDIRSPQDVITLVNRLNREGVAVHRRLSPRVLIEMMRLVSKQFADFHESLKPFDTATFNVSWAGEETSLNWFDTARELTERWHHQQQIRLATHRPGIMTPESYHPVLDCFLRGLPHAFLEVKASSGTVLLVEISGECGGQWFLEKGIATWNLVPGSGSDFTARVTVPQELAWRLFTKGIDRSSARAQLEIDGDRDLGEKILNLTAIVG
jgi:uncharacterized protein (TIGR03083 family)